MIRRREKCGIVMGPEVRNLTEISQNFEKSFNFPSF